LDLKNLTLSFDRIVAIPPRDSLSIAKIGERHNPSNRLSSLELVTNVLRTEIKYHAKNGSAIKTNGRVETVVATAPKTIKDNMKKSKSVGGSMSSVMPTSALNRFKIRPSGLVSKNWILALKILLKSFHGSNRE
jgi:hypothetical protein